jgi:hypothetical protein
MWIVGRMTAAVGMLLSDRIQMPALSPLPEQRVRVRLGTVDPQI